MTTLREAAQQALEVLEQFAETKLVRTSGVINDLRTALAEPEHYTHPPQRKPLTDEELKRVCAETFSYDPHVIARAIERAHGIGGKE